jgi:electron transfer flavoprotein alpha subunit
MATLVFVEVSDGKVRKTSLEALAYAHQMGAGVTAIVMGTVSASELETLGKYGAQKVLHVADARLDHRTYESHAR